MTSILYNRIEQLIKIQPMEPFDLAYRHRVLAAVAFPCHCTEKHQLQVLSLLYSRDKQQQWLYPSAFPPTPDPNWVTQAKKVANCYYAMLMLLHLYNVKCMGSVKNHETKVTGETSYFN